MSSLMRIPFSIPPLVFSFENLLYFGDRGRRTWWVGRGRVPSGFSVLGSDIRGEISQIPMHIHVTSNLRALPVRRQRRQRGGSGLSLNHIRNRKQSGFRKRPKNSNAISISPLPASSPQSLTLNLPLPPSLWPNSWVFIRVISA